MVIVVLRTTGMVKIIVCVALLTCSGGEGTSFASAGENIPFSRPVREKMPKAVVSWLKTCLRLDMVACAFVRSQGGRTYVFVSSGSRAAGSASVRVSRITRSGERGAAVRAVFSPASEGTASAQWYDLVSIRDTGWVVTVSGEGKAAPFRIAGLVGLRELSSIAGESRAIKLFSPPPCSVVERTFDVSGVAFVYEGTVLMRLAREGGEVVVRTLATAASAMDWGYFRKTVVVPDSIPSGTPLRLEVYTADEEKGGETNVIQMSLRLH